MVEGKWLIDTTAFSSSARGIGNEGRRKAKTTKWAMKFEFETEALRLLVSRSEKASNRFLHIALQLGFSCKPLVYIYTSA